IRDFHVTGVQTCALPISYGTSEERLGKLLKKRRQDWVISTKVGEEFTEGESTFDFTAGHLRFSVERSLRRLRSDYLDLVLVHSRSEERRVGKGCRARRSR